MNAAADDRSHVEALVREFPRLLEGKEQRLFLPKGWTHIAERLFRELNELLTDDEAKLFKLLELKEKYGTLRVYYAVGRQGGLNVDVVGLEGHTRFATRLKHRAGFPTAEVEALIQQAEADSEVTCAFCGAPGRLRTNQPWVNVACDECHKPTSSN